MISEADIKNSPFSMVAEIDGKLVECYALEPLAPHERELDWLFAKPRFIGRH